MSRQSKNSFVKEASSRTIVLFSKQNPSLHNFCSFWKTATAALVILLFFCGDNISCLAFQNQNDHMRGAWKSQGANQRELVDQLRKTGIIRTDTVQKVMGLVDRGNYCFLRPKVSKSESDQICYADRALGIGLGQTISAPHMHAYALEEIYAALDKTKKNSKKNLQNTKILDVGCGSGYLTACFGRWLSPLNYANTIQGDAYETESILGSGIGGKVFGIDVRKDLVEMTRKNMERADDDLLRNAIVDLSVRDGWKGLPEHAPFDAIHVGAAAASLPKLLANQLAVGGVLIIPIGPQDSSKHQVLYKIRRIQDHQTGADEERVKDHYFSEESFDEKDFEIKSLLGVRYVPLVKGEEL